MTHIQKGSEDINGLIGKREEDLSSGQVWDDCPGSIEVVCFFKESGVFLKDKEVKNLETWLTDYAEMMYHSGKSKNLDVKQDIKTAREVGEFLAELRSAPNFNNPQKGKKDEEEYQTGLHP